MAEFLSESFRISARAQLDELVDGKLLNSEKHWVHYQPFLLSRGYKLRPRYDPNWEPSWKGSDMSSPYDVFQYEDARTPIMNRISFHDDQKGAVAIDATCVADNRHVILKKVKSSSEELRIAQLLSSEPLASDPRNHAVPVLETLYPPDDKDVAFIVMPILLQMNFVPFRRLEMPVTSTLWSMLASFQEGSITVTR
ncbi:hypothetical protein H0H93_000387 [Arthromyces matolae]|nr:hypothetical protein H0H93_000387 [Arthromyces matolae]